MCLGFSPHIDLSKIMTFGYVLAQGKIWENFGVL